MTEYPNFCEEKKIWKKGYIRVAGIDESGRGPLAGPVVAAVVMIKNPKSQIPNPKQIQNSKFQILNLKDSKKLSSKQREKIYKLITKNPAIQWGMGRVSERVIDKINIKNAAELAMEKALRNLEKKMRKKTNFLIIDGKYLKNHKLKTINHKLIIKADEKVFSCAAASIIAKVNRDKIIKKYHKKYPHYGFAQHKGYPTKYHIKMLKKFGPSAIHRLTYKPVKDIIKSDLQFKQGKNISKGDKGKRKKQNLRIFLKIK